MGRLKNVCPHIIDMDMVKDEAGRPALQYQFAFETEVGTFDWVCKRCGSRVSENTIQVVRRRLERALEHNFGGTAKGLLEAQDKTTKLIEKVNRLGGAP